MQQSSQGGMVLSTFYLPAKCPPVPTVPTIPTVAVGGWSACNLPSWPNWKKLAQAQGASVFWTRPFAL